MKSFTVVRSQTVKSGRLDRVGRDDRWIVYTTDDGHTGSVTLPEEDAGDPEKVKAAVLAEEAKHGGIRGQTFTV